jgi:hypothetical protein
LASLIACGVDYTQLIWAAMAVSDDRMNRYAFVRSRAIAALVRLEDLVLLEQY